MTRARLLPEYQSKRRLWQTPGLRQGVAQGVAVSSDLSAKCWSEWQDLNLRPEVRYQVLKSMARLGSLEGEQLSVGRRGGSQAPVCFDSFYKRSGNMWIHRDAAE